MSQRLCMVLALAAGVCVSRGGAAEQAAKPNIVVIVADDLGYADLGVHGCKDIPTPNIDSLAKNGVRFTNGYVSGPYCAPTRAGLLTGRYQQRYGFEFNPGPPSKAGDEVGLPVTEKTLADRLKAAGYRTGMVGKWHLGNKEPFHPLSRGFDEYFGFLGGAHSYFESGRGANTVLRGKEAAEEKEYLTDAFAREAAAFVEKHREKPFFLYLAFNAVHTPMHATEKYLTRFANIGDKTRRTYAAMLSAMDDAVGALLAKLRSAAVEENTLIFFVSDNGGPERANASDNGPWRGQKAQTWEGGIHVPFFVQWKAKLPGGKTYDHPVIQLDILPTALAAADVEVPPDAKIDGVNLLPYLAGAKSGAPHEALYWRFGTQMAIRMGDWKLVKAPGQGIESGERRHLATNAKGAGLFNLAEDPGEETDLAAKKPDKFQELEAAWKSWSSQLVDPKWRPARAAKKKAKKESLAPSPG